MVCSICVSQAPESTIPVYYLPSLDHPSYYRVSAFKFALGVEVLEMSQMSEIKSLVNYPVT